MGKSWKENKEKYNNKFKSRKPYSKNKRAFKEKDSFYFMDRFDQHDVMTIWETPKN